MLIISNKICNESEAWTRLKGYHHPHFPIIKKKMLDVLEPPISSDFLSRAKNSGRQ
jgi:hypothetical protein